MLGFCYKSIKSFKKFSKVFAKIFLLNVPQPKSKRRSLLYLLFALTNKVMTLSRRKLYYTCNAF